MRQGWKEAVWQNGKKTVKGRWQYHWAADKFYIELDRRDSITGSRTRTIIAHGDEPEWGNWKLVRN